MLTNTVCDKRLNAKATRWEDAQAVAASLRDFPLTWRRNTQIQMYWPWKWFELYNNCTFSTWKDKFVFNLLFWIPNSVCGFRYYGGRHSLPCLSWRHVTDFLLFRILSNFHLPWKQSLSWNFSLYWNIFIFQDFWATCACPEKQSAWIHSIEYIHFFIQNFEQFALALKTEFALNFSLH